MQKQIQISPTELEVMNLLWDKHQLKAADIARLAEDNFNWKRNTTYTYVARLIKKNYVMRVEPDFVCIPIITREAYMESETDFVVNKHDKEYMLKFIFGIASKGGISEQAFTDMKNMLYSEEP